MISTVAYGGERRQMLPMELCQVVPGQKFAKKLNPEQTAQCLKCPSSSSSCRSLRLAGD